MIGCEPVDERSYVRDAFAVDPKSVRDLATGEARAATRAGI